MLSTSVPTITWSNLSVCRTPGEGSAHWSGAALPSASIDTQLQTCPRPAKHQGSAGIERRRLREYFRWRVPAQQRVVVTGRARRSPGLDTNYEGDENIVEVYIGYLRKKVDLPFEPAASKPFEASGTALSAPPDVGSVGSGIVNLESTATARALADGDGLGDAPQRFRRDGESESGATSLPRPRLVEVDEASEDRPAFCCRDSGPVVLDHDLGVVAVFGAFEMHHGLKATALSTRLRTIRANAWVPGDANRSNTGGDRDPRDTVDPLLRPANRMSSRSTSTTVPTDSSSLSSERARESKDPRLIAASGVMQVRLRDQRVVEEIRASVCQFQSRRDRGQRTAQLV